MSKIILRCVASIMFVVGIISCATTPPPTLSGKPAGFLPDYSLLKSVVPSPDGFQFYVYKNPKIKKGMYTSVIVDPVILYQTASESGVTEAQIESARLAIGSDIKGYIGNRYKIVTESGSGVARVNVAITGAMLEGDGFSPRYLMPIGAVLKVTSMAAGIDNKTPVLVIETKATDSKTGELLTASVTTVSGETFRLQSSTPEEFQALAKTWVQEAIARAAQSNN